MVRNQGMDAALAAGRRSRELLRGTETEAGSGRVQSDTEVLEAMIDRHSLVHVLTALELVCSEKAAHIRSNWSNSEVTAMAWDKTAAALYKLALKVEV